MFFPTTTACKLLLGIACDIILLKWEQCCFIKILMVLNKINDSLVTNQKSEKNYSQNKQEAFGKSEKI